jgi:cell division transport system permease protein
MSADLQPKHPKKYKPTFVYAIASISLNLFIMGLFALGIYFTQKEIKKVRESVEVELILRDSLSHERKVAIEKYLKKKDFIGHVDYRSKDEAAAIYEKELGQNFREVLGYNPLYDAFIVNLKAENSNPEFVADVKSAFLSQVGVKEVNYSQPVMDMLGTTFKPVTFGIFLLCIILFIVAFMVIDTTIRLMMYSQRYSIRTMQLIGATEWFIVKPFLKRSAISGMISGFIAILVVSLVYYLTHYKFNVTIESSDFVFLLMLGGLLIGMGVFISALSTYFAVKKYIGVKLDELY